MQKLLTYRVGPVTRCCSGHHLGRALSGVEAQGAQAKGQSFREAGPCQHRAGIEGGNPAATRKPCQAGKEASQQAKPPTQPLRFLQASHENGSSRKYRAISLAQAHACTCMPARIEQSCLSPCGLSRTNSFSLVFLVSNRRGRLEVWWTFFIPKMMSSTSWEKIVISALCQDRMHL